MARLPALCGVCILAASAAAQPSFTALGDLPGGPYRSRALGVSGNGSTVVGWSSTADATSVAFKWTVSTGMINLGHFFNEGEPYSVANAASYSGSVIVGASTAHGNTYAAMWTSGGINTIQDTTVPIAGEATDVSDNGLVVCGRRSFGGGIAFRYVFLGGGSHSFPAAPGAPSAPTRATGLSGDGNTVALEGPGSDGNPAILRWTAAAGTVDLGRFPYEPTGAAARAISADGAVTVGYVGRMASRWTSPSAVQPLGFVSATNPGSTVANAASGDGRVIVGTFKPTSVADPYVAFIWTQDEGMRDLKAVLLGMGLDVAGWNLTEATGISDNGRIIVGYGTDPFGAQEAAWMADLGPAPCPADYNGDGFVDGIDYDQFNNDFEAGC